MFLESTVRDLLGELAGVFPWNLDDRQNALLDYVKANKLINSYRYLFPDDDRIEPMYARQVRKRESAAVLLEEVSEVLKRKNAGYAIIKGMSFERAIYGDIPVRDIGDIDILVKAEDASAVHRALLDMGYQQQLGPSSGSMGEGNKASFIAAISRQSHVTSSRPVRRFPFKDSYCPYTKCGCPTIEVHDGFRGLPKWYTDEVVDRASENESSLTLDLTDVLIFLLVNTYENSESFYSNYYDAKLVIRDYVDLACLYVLCREKLDWGSVRNAINTLGLLEKAGRVLHNLDLLFPGEFAGLLDDVPRLPSLWGLSFRERLLGGEARRRAVLRVFRSDMSLLAAKAAVGIHPALVQREGRSCRVESEPAFELKEDELGLKLCIHLSEKEKFDTTCIAFRFYPIDGDEPPLCNQVMVRIERDRVQSFVQEFDRMPDGMAAWNEMGRELSACMFGSVIEVLILSEEAKAILHSGRIAVMSCIYDKHYGDTYWTRCRGKLLLSADVPIGFLSLFSNTRMVTVHISLSFGVYVVSTEGIEIAEKVFSLFDSAGMGMPIDCDNRSVRAAVIVENDEGGFDVRVEGAVVAVGAEEACVLSVLMQDITDWCVCCAKETCLVVHAASNLAGDGMVLLMGPSGSGKSTLSLALSGEWPLRSDECVCVDADKAMAWSEALPVNIKLGNAFADDLLDASKGVACLSPVGGVTRYHNRNSVSADSKPFARKRINAIYFPTYDPACSGVELNRLGETDFARRVLRSIVGGRPPSANFGSFVRMIAKYGIPLFEVRYSSVKSAAHCLVECMGRTRG